MLHFRKYPIFPKQNSKTDRLAIFERSQVRFMCRSGSKIEIYYAFSWNYRPCSSAFWISWDIKFIKNRRYQAPNRITILYSCISCLFPVSDLSWHRSIASYNGLEYTDISFLFFIFNMRHEKLQKIFLSTERISVIRWQIGKMIY